jgi:predicted ester cyclase
MSEALSGGNVDALDELLVPNYHDLAMGGLDRAGFKAMLPAMRTAITDMSFDILNLVAEGDAVVARLTLAICPTRSGQELADERRPGC